MIGISCGLACFPVAFFGGFFNAILPVGPPRVVIPFLYLSTLAGIVGCAFGTFREAEVFAGFGPRLGIRASFVATLVGGACAVLASTLHSLGSGSVPQVYLSTDILAAIFPTPPAWRTLIVALIGLPPSIFFGIAAALVTSMLRAPILFPTKRPGMVVKPFRERDALMNAVLVFAIAGYLSPLGLFLKSYIPTVHFPLLWKWTSAAATKLTSPKPYSLSPRELEAFIRAHHAKAARDAVESIVSDYSDKVDFFNDGIVDKAYIRKSQTAFHAPGARIAETVHGDILVSEVAPMTFMLSYELDYSVMQPDGKWSNILSDMKTEVRVTPEGPIIIWQRGETRDKKEGNR